jgi:beta-mannosidase
MKNQKKLRGGLLLIVTLLCVIIVSRAAVQPDKLKWELSWAQKINDAPSAWITAEVPGAVQIDIARDKKWGPFYYAENWKDYLPYEDNYYTYRTNFSKPALKNGERLFFISKGIDYEFDIYLNNEKLFHQEGMFTPVKLDLTDKLVPIAIGTNELKVQVYPVPKLYPTPLNRGQAANVTKPAVSYGWDFHPRLVPLGIWDETFLEVQPGAYVNDVWVNYQLGNRFDAASITLTAKGRNLSGNRYVWKLLDKEGKEVLNKTGNISSPEAEFTAELQNPSLWWPHDQGTPYLYASVFELQDGNGNTIQKVSQKVGFRRIKLVMNSGAWQEPEGYPKSRSNPPAQFEINGRRIFAKGSNMVNADVFPGTITRERYNKLLDLVKGANFNIVRLWGGAIINKEPFYELCDEKGILVWQEFPLACNNYPDNPHYLQILEQEATSIILKIKKHPCLALWCGGNELFNSWSGMTDQSLALRLLNSLTLKLDPQTPFNPTSPLSGMAHGHYVFRDWDTGEEVYARMKRSHYTAYTEFGMPAPASVEILKKIIPENELWPPKEGTSWDSHHGFKAWIGETHLVKDMLASYFGPAKNLEELVEEGQLLQGEGFKAIFEEARRQKPYCAMALNWCFNEPWYCAANNSIVSYPDTPKPGYYEVSKACRPFCASATLTKFKWTDREEFSTKLWLLNDLPEAVPGGKITVKLVAGDKSMEIMKWEYPKLTANTNMEGPVTAPVRLPSWNTSRIKLVVEIEGKPEYSSEYTILYQQRNRPGRSLPALNQ